MLKIKILTITLPNHTDFIAMFEFTITKQYDFSYTEGDLVPYWTMDITNLAELTRYENVRIFDSPEDIPNEVSQEQLASLWDEVRSSSTEAPTFVPRRK